MERKNLALLCAGVVASPLCSALAACRRSSISSWTRLSPANWSRSRSSACRRVAIKTPLDVSTNTRESPCSQFWLARSLAGSTNRPRSPNGATNVVLMHELYHHEPRRGTERRASHSPSSAAPDHHTEPSATAPPDHTRPRNRSKNPVSLSMTRCFVTPC